MHFMIHTLRIIIFAILISNIITKQNENTTSRNNTHTIKESDDNEYVDIKNKELDNNIKNNESDKSKDVDMVSKLIILYITFLCVGMLVIVIKNCRWENISQCNRQCQLGIRRNCLIVRDCCRRRFRYDINTDDQPSYHAEHFCEDFCRWCLAFDYFNFRRSNPNPDHQPERAQWAARVQRIEVAEASVIFDGSNVSIQEHHANFRRSNPNPDHQPERAERAQRVERAQLHVEAEPSIIYDRSNVSIQEQNVFMETDF